MKREEHPIKQIIEEAIEKINKSIDVNKAIGTPIIAGGDIIIPITKISVGFVAGGGEYNQEVPPKNADKEYPFAGGSGAGFNMAPIGFLICNSNGTRYIELASSNIDKFIDTINNISQTLSKKD